MQLLMKILLQTTFAFFTILLLTRILGKQQLAQLTYYEYINGITFGSIAATMATDTNQVVWQHFAGLVFFGVLTFLMSYISLKSRPLRKIISGEPVIVVQDGKIMENNLKKMRYDLDELYSQLREKNIFDIQVVEYAIIETSGKFSVLKKAEADTPTRKDLGIPGISTEIQIEVIIDGQLIYTNLKRMGLDGKWLMNQLEINGVKSFKEVAYASLDANHNLYVDLFNDKLQGMVDISDDAQIPFSMDSIKMGEQDSIS